MWAAVQHGDEQIGVGSLFFHTVWIAGWQNLWVVRDSVAPNLSQYPTMYWFGGTGLARLDAFW